MFEPPRAGVIAIAGGSRGSCLWRAAWYEVWQVKLVCWKERLLQQMLRNCSSSEKQWFAFIHARWTVQVAKMVFWVSGFNWAMFPLCIQPSHGGGKQASFELWSSDPVRHIAENDLGFLEEIRSNARTHRVFKECFFVSCESTIYNDLRKLVPNWHCSTHDGRCHLHRLFIFQN